MDIHKTIQLIAVWALPVLFAVTLHEAAHGWVAYLFGDKTAFLAGRISPNPIRHIDPIGTILVPGLLLLTTNFIFGWAKPVPVDARNLRQPRRDMALVALAGPLCNLIQACLWSIVFKTATFLLRQKIAFATPLILMAEAGILINVFLAALNLIPIPPLDGSKVVGCLLPVRIEKYYNAIEPFGFIILLFLLVTNILSKIMKPVTDAMFHFLQWLV